MKVAGCAVPFLILLAACVSQAPMNRAIPLAARERISTTDVLIPIGQRELVIAIPSTTWAYRWAAPLGPEGMIVGTFVNASIDALFAFRAESSLKPLREMLTDFSFDDTLNADIEARMPQAAWMNPVGYSVVKDVTPHNLEQILKQSKASSVLLVSSEYNLNRIADELTITLSGRVLPNTTELQALLPERFDPNGSQIKGSNDLYRNTFSFIAAIPGATEIRDNNIALWSANGGAQMREALILGSAKLTEMLVADLVAEPVQPIDEETTKLPKIAINGVTGYVGKADDLGTLILLPTGGQIYVTKVALELLSEDSSN